MLSCVLYLPSGLDATDSTHIQHTPGTRQAEQDPPLDGARVTDGSGDVESLSVPEVVHRRALSTLFHVACRTRAHIKVWVESGDKLEISLEKWQET